MQRPLYIVSFSDATQSCLLEAAGSSYALFPLLLLLQLLIRQLLCFAGCASHLSHPGSQKCSHPPRHLSRDVLFRKKIRDFDVPQLKNQS